MRSRGEPVGDEIQYSKKDIKRKNAMIPFSRARLFLLRRKFATVPIVAPCVVAIVVLLFASVPSGLAQTESPRNKKDSKQNMTAEIEAIEAFVAAFNARDVEAVMEFFAPDAVYHNMPMTPVKGTKAIRVVIGGFVAPAKKIDWEILKIAQVDSTVLTERIDRFVMNGKSVELPVMGAFDMRDGKIVAWRDYFDMATWRRQTSTNDDE